ncbi:MAG: SDR family NAD(P)-dependent oxidoreductase [Mesorhizobium sp.]|nr:SDR family NAD(P)-dependent oxidoreductase [Mesorhizobium sp.]
MRSRLLITGATAGIGLAMARRRAAGADLLLTGRQEHAAVRDRLPPGAAYVAADQSSPEAAAGAVRGALDRLGWDRLDLAVLNAGAGHALDPATESAQSIRVTLDVNLAAAIALAQTLLPFLENASGKLVLVGSTAHRGAPGFASYAASKAGLDGLARALREEWRGRVAVQIVHPGPTATGMHEKAGHDPGPIGRMFARPETTAARIEAAIASGRSPVTIPFARYAAADSLTTWMKR